MKIEGKVAVITGGASGIGRELARRFKAEGAAGIVVADVQEETLVAVAEEVGGLAAVTDVTKESEIQTLVERAENEVGPIDIFCSNAGIARLGDVYASNDEWQLNWDIHVMAHVYAARLVAPRARAVGNRRQRRLCELRLARRAAAPPLGAADAGEVEAALPLDPVPQIVRVHLGRRRGERIAPRRQRRNLRVLCGQR